jgi:nitric oxide dioxygenase
MTTEQKDLIKETVPVLRTNGIDLTKHFYKRMFTNNPELRNIFNMGNQANGKQQNALAMAVLVYAEHIENPTVLINTLKAIGNKHVSLNITAEQYDIVGLHLINSIKEVLGDAATDKLIEAWVIAYNDLAQIMISIEQEMYEANEKADGGWKGWRSFTIANIVEESDEIKSFYLKPVDQNKIINYLPGQYLTIKTYIPELGHEQPRQYSLSMDCNTKHYRISVKKEVGTKITPEGIVSNHMHQKNIGDIILVSAPAGIFHASLNEKNPLVLISGGVGITPLMSILETNKKSEYQNQTVWMHACRNENVHAFKETVDVLSDKNDWLTSFVFYENTEIENDKIIKGRIDLKKYKNEILINEAKYYICGPEVFIQTQYDSLIELGVTKENIFYEEFGPSMMNLN